MKTGYGGTYEIWLQGNSKIQLGWGYMKTAYRRLTQNRLLPGELIIKKGLQGEGDTFNHFPFSLICKFEKKHSVFLTTAL